MAALFLTTLFALIGITAAGVLADSGLRWWSAFGRLRRDLAREAAVAAIPVLPVQRAMTNHACFHRGPMRNRDKANRLSRAAA